MKIHPCTGYNASLTWASAPLPPLCCGLQFFTTVAQDHRYILLVTVLVKAKKIIMLHTNFTLPYFPPSPFYFLGTMF
jgi:hypothetical protein